MKQFHPRTLAAALLMLLAGAASCLHAAEFQLGRLRISHPWTPPSKPGARHADIYMRIDNFGGAERLVAARSSLAQHFAFVDDAYGVVERAPYIEMDVKGPSIMGLDRMHVRLLNLTRPLESGDTFELTLVFDNAGPVVVEVEVDDR